MTTSSELQLTLIERQQKLSSELSLYLGTDDTVINSCNLPLKLTNSDRPNSGELPLPLGQVVNSGDADDGDIDPLPRPKLPSLFSCLEITTSSSTTVTNCQKLTTSNSKTISNDTDISTKASVRVINCQFVKTINYVNISNCHQFTNSHTRQINKCQYVFVYPLFNISNCQKATVSAIKTVENCNQINSQPTHQIAHCQKVDTVAVEQIKHCFYIKNKGVSIASLHDLTVQPAIPVPCRYYPIPPPPVVKPNTGVCRIRPPASDLPLTLVQRQVEMLASDLPLNLACWHDTPALQIPIKDTYMIHTIFTADIGGIEVDPLYFKISTDMKSYCWRGSVGISPDDFSRIEGKLNTDVGDEVLVNININGHKFSIIAEDVSRTRTFEMHTHNIEGRSITARLGSDYIKANDKLFNQDNYAQQIVNQQLQNTPFAIDNWDVNDWFIPADSYAVSNKTPIAVIADIAETVGGYVESHYHEPKLSIKKRWKTRAWEIDKVTPDITIPYHVIIHSDDRTKQSPRYNTVMLIGNKDGFDIYRKAEGRDMSAPTVNNPLCTDKNVTIPSGIAIISESGKHRVYQLTMPWTNEISLSELGQLVQIDDMDESWRGIITAIEVIVKRQNKAVKPYQLITVDRYMDY